MDDNNKKAVNEGKATDRQHEEDESWISGEELYTEESTEEDEGKLSDNALQERKKKRENRRIKAKRLASRPVRKDASSSTNVGNNVDFLTEEETIRNIANSSVECVDVASRVDSLVDNIYEKMVKETRPFDEEKHARLLKDIKMPKDVVQLGGIYEELSKRDPTLSDALLKMYQLDMILEKKEEKLKALCQKRKSCYSEDGTVIAEENVNLLEVDFTAQIIEDHCCKSAIEDESSLSTATSTTEVNVNEPALVTEPQDYTVDQEKVMLECSEDHGQLTDDEKKRIEELLTDYDTSQPDAGDSATGQVHSLQSFQLIDEETEKQLEAIEQQLKQLTTSALATPATKYTTPVDNELNYVEIESLDRPHGDEKYKFFSSESKLLLKDIDSRLKALHAENQEHDANIRELLESLEHSPLPSPLPESEDAPWNLIEEDIQNLLLHSDSTLSPDDEVLTDIADLGGEPLDTTGAIAGEETLDKSS